MTRPSLSARNRRALRLGAIIAAPILLYALALRPFATHLAGQTQALERERDLLQRERVLLAGAVSYPPRVLRAQEALEMHRPRGFSGPDAVSSTARLASHVTDLATESEVQVDRTEAHAPVDGDAGTELRVTMNATADIAGLMRWLHALESGRHLVVVERLVVRGADLGGAGYGSAPGSGAGTDLLYVWLDLLGFASRADLEARS